MIACNWTLRLCEAFMARLSAHQRLGLDVVNKAFHPEISFLRACCVQLCSVLPRCYDRAELARLHALLSRNLCCSARCHLTFCHLSDCTQARTAMSLFLSATTFATLVRVVIWCSAECRAKRPCAQRSPAGAPPTRPDPCSKTRSVKP